MALSETEQVGVTLVTSWFNYSAWCMCWPVHSKNGTPIAQRCPKWTKTAIFLAMFTLGVAGPQAVWAQTPAFPGAEGFGRFAQGGRGGQIVKISNLNDSGAGSLRNCIDKNFPRICLFEVSGIIEVQSSLIIDHGESHITIAGQSAPYPGITIRSHPHHTEALLQVAADHVIIQHLRIRPGPSSDTTSIHDAIEIIGGSRSMYDHLSVSWGTDETFSSWFSPQNVTVQNSIISEGLFCSTHSNGCHSKGILISGEGSGSFSIVKNLIAHQRQRLPLVKTATGSSHIVNNVTYNPEWDSSYSQDDFGLVQIDYINNYFKQGPNTRAGGGFIEVDDSTGNKFSIFARGNALYDRAAQQLYLDQYRGSLARYIVPAPHALAGLNILPLEQAYEYVLDSAGATMQLDLTGEPVNSRDVVDMRVVYETRSGTGSIIDGVGNRCWKSVNSDNQLRNGIGYPPRVDQHCLSVSDYRNAGLDVTSSDFDDAGWPLFVSNTRPAGYDSDNDGLYDLWEQRYFESLLANPNEDPDGDGYTNIEELLNVTDPGNPSQVVPQPTPTFIESAPVPIATPAPTDTAVADTCSDSKLEAEQGQLYGAFEIANDVDASGGQYVHVPDGAISRVSEIDSAHRVDFCFYLPASGKYQIMARAHAENAKTDTFYIRVNDWPQGGYVWQLPQTTGFTDHQVTNASNSQPIETDLPAGMNRVSLYLREDGTKLDSVALINVAPIRSPAQTAVPDVTPQPPSNFNIRGYVYIDLNHNGLQDGGDRPLENAVALLIDLSKGERIAVLSTSSSQDGSYAFANVSPGQYAVNFMLPPGHGPASGTNQLIVPVAGTDVLLPSFSVIEQGDRTYLPFVRQLRMIFYLRPYWMLRDGGP